MLRVRRWHGPLVRVATRSLAIRWRPLRSSAGNRSSPTGPVSIVLRHGSHRVVVYRDGIEIGRARLAISGDERMTNHVLVLMEGPSSTPDPYLPDATKYRWVRIGVPGHTQEAGTQVNAAALARIKLPPEFVREVNSILTRGQRYL